MYYDKNGKKINSVFEWAKLIEDDDYKVIQQDKLKNGYLISTVWLGIDHNFSMEGNPLIFETMVFGGDEEYQERYSTLEEAKAGHLKVLEKFKNKLKINVKK